MPDILYALRLLKRQFRFTLLVVLTMAIGIGSTTALFSVTYGVLLKPLPWPTADRLIVLKERRGGHAPRFGSFSNAAYLAWRDQPGMIDEIAAWSPRTVTLTGEGEPERIRATAITPSLFRAIGARPIAGALFNDNDDAAPVVVISESLWRQRFGGDARAIGRGVQMDGEARTIVGVLPDAMGYPDRNSRAWLPFRVAPASNNLLTMFEAIARVRPGVSAAQAAAEGTSRGRFAADTGMTTMAIFGGDGPVEVAATPLTDSLTAEVRTPLIVVLAAVSLLLLIAATNVASLHLARATARRRELAIRAAIGASGTRILRQLVVENLILGLLGGAAGIALAWILQRGAHAMLPSDFPRATEPAVDPTVILFAVGVTIVTSLAFGLLVAMRVRRLNLVASLVEDGAAPVGAGRRSGVARARMAIVTAQIALAGLLLVGALLLGRSFVTLLHADRGYDPARVMSARLSLPAPQYTPARRAEVLEHITANMSRIPGVEAAAFSTELPLTPGGSTSAFTMPARDSSSAPVTVQASPRIVSPAYFSALGLRVLTGRPLLDADTAASQPVVVVNETFRRRYLANDAMGARLPMSLWGQNQSGDAIVVGVVEDVRYIGSATTSLAEIYFSYRQLKVGVRPTTSALFMRSSGDLNVIAASVKDAVAGADASVIPEAIMTLEERLLAGSLARPRLYAVLVAIFAGVALVVTGVGLFSVLSYTVSQRTRELGVRAALGATEGDLARLVLRQALAVAAAGIGIGLAASFWLSGFLSTLLYGITTGDVATYVTVPIVLLIVILLACLGPARRAAKLDPIKALKGS